jgi:hypothetical protein
MRNNLWQEIKRSCSWFYSGDRDDQPVVKRLFVSTSSGTSRCLNCFERECCGDFKVFPTAVKKSVMELVECNEMRNNEK